MAAPNLSQFKAEQERKLIECKKLSRIKCQQDKRRSLKEEHFQKLKKIQLMKLGDRKYLLEKEYGLFLEGHTENIWHLAITSDNKYAVTASNDKTVRIWSLQDKAQICILRGHTGAVISLEITADNFYIISSSLDNTVRIWSFHERKQECILEEHTSYVKCIALTKDNKYIITGSYDSTIIIWDFKERKRNSVLLGHTDSVNAIIVTDDDNFIVSGSSDKTTRLWSFKTKLQIASVWNYCSVLRLALSPYNRYIISITHNCNVLVWDLQIIKFKSKLSYHNCTIKTINDEEYMKQCIKTKDLIAWKDGAYYEDVNVAIPNCLLNHADSRSEINKTLAWNISDINLVVTIALLGKNLGHKAMTTDKKLVIFGWVDMRILNLENSEEHLFEYALL